MGFDLRFGAGLGNSSEAPQEPHSLLFPFKSHVSLKQTKRRANCPPLCLAEKVGFEPTHRSSQSTPLAGEPLIATWVFLHMAEMVGFEPTGTCMPTVFKTASLDHSDTSPCFLSVFSMFPASVRREVYQRGYELSMVFPWRVFSIHPRKTMDSETPSTPARSSQKPA